MVDSHDRDKAITINRHAVLAQFHCPISPSLLSRVKLASVYRVPIAIPNHMHPVIPFLSQCFVFLPPHFTAYKLSRHLILLG